MSSHTVSGRPVGPVWPSWAGLACFTLASLAVALIGGLAAANASATYAALERPGWAPPSWLFGPVWTVLYALIAVSGWLVWRRYGWRGARSALMAFAAQLTLNLAWTPLFFGLGLYGVAFAEIVLLWGAIALTIGLFWHRDRSAAALLLPYLAWVSYAAALNLSIVLMN